MITDRDAIQPGAVLTAKYKGQTYTAKVLEDGRFYIDEKGITSPSLSGAGMAITKSQTNGWRFWSLVEEDAVGPSAYAGLDPETGQPNGDQEDAETPSETAPVSVQTQRREPRTFRKVPNQRGLPDGEVRWWCSACQKGFNVTSTARPARCPEGHDD